jgi:dTDP-4-amino-4,6-dideoxygalactose transaminase
MAEQLRVLRNHGSKSSYRHERIGYNSRLDELQAAVLLVKFRKIDQYNDMRRKNAKLYNELFSGKVASPVERGGFAHVYHQYTIRSPQRDEIKDRLSEAGIASTVYYPVALHLQEALEFLGYKKGDFKNAEQAADEVLSLPMYPELEESEIGQIAEIVLKSV